MRPFLFVGLNPDGSRITGELEATSEKEAVRTLHRRGLTLVRLDPLRPKGWIWYVLNPVRPAELVLFIRQLAVLVEAAVPLQKALACLLPQHARGRFRRTLEKLLLDISVGYSLSQAMLRSPEVFSGFLSGSARIGEASGRLGATLAACAAHMEKEYNYGLKLRQALLYPCVLLLCAGLLVAFIFTFMIPRFFSLFEGTGVELPWASRWLMDGAAFLEQYGLPILLTIWGPCLAVLWVLARWARTPGGRRVLERLLLRLPGYGIQVRRRMLAHYFGSFATLVSSGVAISASLRLLEKSLDRQLLIDAARAQSQALGRGRGLVGAMKRARFFPPMAIEMVRVGVETGRLDEMLFRLSAAFDEEMSRGLDTLSRLVEPAVLTVLGSAVAIVLLAAFLPIYQLAGSF
jgi:type II secretory pathway component PulF